MNTEHANAANTNQGRDAAGRFAAGNKGGPGNPFARKVAGLRTALIDAVSPQDLQEIAASLILQAKDGNVQAARLIFSYVIGKPQPAPEPDHLDVDEWNIYRETAPMKKEAAPLMQAGDPEFHLDCMRTMRPLVTLAMKTEMAKELNETPEEREAREDAEAAECERILNTPTEVPDCLKHLLSPNGEFDAAPPSPNGDFGAELQAHDRFKPSLNGDSHRAGTTES